MTELGELLGMESKATSNDCLMSFIMDCLAGQGEGVVKESAGFLAKTKEK